ncbi:RsmB/NOP family class I SAM-dependent RNA methyltransferase [Nocardioides acrostichi]|uniref:RsmB/NOP family class I SAM-dependent RNA methyltransferase n=1 Tax=Nocardioides acrostichi TaxID=2784339 RepID=UPI002E2A6A3D|nr:transcription antitermination factor NusB [Nocardioides acrostichi]
MVDPAREAAVEVLTAVREADAYANLVLPVVLRRHGLTGRDAGLVTELVSGTIRRRGTYDAVLAACSDRPLERVEPAVLDLLRLGTHQLLAMRVPPHAAISTTVDLAGGRGTGGFVNAVLRRVSERDREAWLRQVAPPRAQASDRHDAVVHSHPVWVVAELRRALAAAGGAEEVEALLAADNAPPRVTLVARPGLAERTELPGEPTPFSRYGVALEGGDPGTVPAVAEGRAGVQDEGSQLVALALAEAALEGRDGTWLDVCAGPGGKSALLASLAAGRGARLIATERQHHRARLVRRNLAAVPGDHVVLTADGTRPPLVGGGVDRVLVDAPCTGLGALRRRPEARWRRERGDLKALSRLQERLLAAALDVVRPGGLVLYATCSPVLAETERVVSRTVRRRDDATLVPLDLGIAASAGPVPGTVQLWPHRHGTDAMFLALFRRDVPSSA